MKKLLTLFILAFSLSTKPTENTAECGNRAKPML